MGNIIVYFHSLLKLDPTPPPPTATYPENSESLRPPRLEIPGYTSVHIHVILPVTL